MGLTDFTLRRLAPAAAATTAAAWAGVTTLNDDWDDYFHRHAPPSASTTDDASEQRPERIVILGSGWAALSALRKCAGPNKSVVVVSPRPHFLYTPLLASSSVGTITLRSACRRRESSSSLPVHPAAGVLERGDHHPPIGVRAAEGIVEKAAERAASATFVRADAREVDLAERVVRATTDSDGMMLELSYDKLVVAVGSQANTFGIPGVQEHALFLKEAEDSAKLHARLLSNLEKAAALSHQGEKYCAEIDRLLKVVVVGGGPTGVELSAELADFAHNDVARRYGRDISDRIRIVLVEAMPRILAPFDESLANVAKEHLIFKGVDVRTGAAVTHVDAKDVTLAPSTPRSATAEQRAAAAAAAESEEVGALVWAAGIGARPLVKKLAKSLGQTDMRGLIVDEDLKVKGAEGVYAVGDAALSGFPPTAQVAAQQGKHVGRAIRDGTDTKFEYRHAGSLCSLGSGNGIAQLTNGFGGGAFNVWDALGAPTVGRDGKEVALTGRPAFVLWRSLYWTKLLSASSRLSLGSDWMRARLSGRDVVEPVLKRTVTLKLPVESFGTELKRNDTIRLVNKTEALATAAATDSAEGKRKKRFWFF
eukprot:CAMPEP_0172574364 /NCGR_PEP_ID=MMETSP1067-20121228/136663_1 /TAXON_ID=265564 ORGANISM="Thalassiosira punctigera, Strain Tpunct2005C2" /NCGR_SAMPLE_ID=MMETSP1067 /ASSEMBLY_ACC=CAM_ASM_000444 /LENGTH=593 /DNA_ID=CAMNT_0013366989 /DNA_START=59 /DNA_END=1841 /DNA_ORIENTATION=+